MLIEIFWIPSETKEEFEMAAEKSEYIKKAYEDLNRISADEGSVWNMRQESVRFEITSIFLRFIKTLDWKKAEGKAEDRQL